MPVGDVHSRLGAGRAGPGSGSAGEGDIHGAEHGLGKAIAGADGDVLVLLNEAMAALDDGDATAAESAMREALALLGVSDFLVTGHLALIGRRSVG